MARRREIAFQVFYHRVVDSLGIDSQLELARALGVNRSAVTQAKRRDSVPERWLLQLSREYGLDAEWLAGGSPGGARRTAKADAAPTVAGNVAANDVDAARRREAGDGAGYGEAPAYMGGDAGKVDGAEYDAHGANGEDGDEASILPPEVDFSDFERVPKVRARLCAGDGSFEVGGEVEEYYAFQRTWLTRKGAPGAMVLMDVFGTSMEPEIREGDTVLIDTSKRDVFAGGVYAVGVEDTVMVKRLEKRPGGLALLSDNPDYDPIVLRGDEMNTVRVIGRLVWSCREYR